MKHEPTQVFIVFIVVWVALGLGLAGLTYFNRDAAFKRRIHPPIMIGVGALFLAFILLSGTAPAPFLVLMVPMIVLITFLNVKLTKFCDACGETVYHSRKSWRPAEFCPKCGAPLA